MNANDFQAHYALLDADANRLLDPRDVCIVPLAALSDEVRFRFLSEQDDDLAHEVATACGIRLLDLIQLPDSHAI